MNDHRKPKSPRTGGPRRDDRESAAEGERIAKRLARAGVASRREAETMIAAGRIAVNGVVLSSPAVNVQAADKVTIDGKPIPEIERTRLFLFHKPAGTVTTNRDPEGRRTIFEILPEGLPRLMTVGRLDMNTEGLLLLTNDGGLARVLELPRTGWLRRYRVRVHGEVDEAALAGLSEGIAVDGVYYGAIDAALDRRQGTNAWLTLGLREGKNREVRNVLGALGLEVTRLIRISYGPFQLGELPEGAVLEIKGRMLRDQLGQRLIDEAGADFDAPVATAFPNRPVASEGPARERKPRAAAMPEPGEGGLIKRRKGDRLDRREAALGRLGTKPPRPGSRTGKDDRKDDKPTGRRNVNVWMAPGARPKGPKPARKPDEETAERPRPPGKPRPEAERPRRPAARTEGIAGERPPRARREREDGAPAQKRPYRLGKAEREGRQYVPKGEPRRSDGERPARAREEGGERRFSRQDKPPFKGKPRPDRPKADRPAGPGKPRGPRKGGGNADRRR